MSLDEKIPRSFHGSRKGDTRADLKRFVKRKRRRFSKLIARGDEKAEGKPLIHGWAD